MGNRQKLLSLSTEGIFISKLPKKSRLQLSVGRGHSTLLGGHLNFISEFDKVI